MSQSTENRTPNQTMRELVNRVAELEAENKRLQDERDALYRDCPGV